MNGLLTTSFFTALIQYCACSFFFMFDVNVNHEVRFHLQPGKEVGIDDLPEYLTELLKVDLFEKYGKKTYSTNVAATTAVVAAAASASASTTMEINKTDKSPLHSQCIKMTHVTIERRLFHDKAVAIVKDSCVKHRTFIEMTFNVKTAMTMSRKALQPQQFLLQQPLALQPIIPSLTISKYNYSLLSRQKFSGSYYAWMIVHYLQNKKKDTNIGVSKNPFYSVYLHNNQFIVNKNTSSAAPHWELDTVAGPFETEETALEFAREWVSQTRGGKSKRKKADDLHKVHGVNLYTRKMTLNQPFDQFLVDANASIHHVKHVQKVMSRK
jgi:hypothetical protein